MRRVFLLLLVASLAACQTSPKPTLISGTELQALIGGKAVKFLDGSVATYFADGKYSYKYAQQLSAGNYIVTGDTVCVVFTSPAGAKRCDNYALVGADHYLIDRGGRRYKVLSFTAMPATEEPKPE